jgi:hypothetical protein
VEYFIKRIGEEQKRTGLRLLDVLDFHFYPGTDNNPDLTMQLHRIWFDTTYVYPLANGSKLLGGGWNERINREFIGERCRRWLMQYCGADHGITIGMTECGAVLHADPNVAAVWYASHLGTFADEGVEVFTPWEWYAGQWEVLHLFSRYCGAIRVESRSDLDSVVSAYSSVNGGADTLTIILVNRDRTSVRDVTVTVNGFTPDDQSGTSLQLNDLPAIETFVSHSSNALTRGVVSLSGSTFSLALPAISVTAVLLRGKGAVIHAIQENRQAGESFFLIPAERWFLRTVLSRNVPLSRYVTSVEGSSTRASCGNRDAGIFRESILPRVATRFR